MIDACFQDIILYLKNLNCLLNFWNVDAKIGVRREKMKMLTVVIFGVISDKFDGNYDLFGHFWVVSPYVSPAGAAAAVVAGLVADALGAPDDVLVALMAVESAVAASDAAVVPT